MTKEWGQRNNTPILRPGWGLGPNHQSFWQKDGGRSRQLPEQEETNENKMKPEIDTQWVNHSHPRKVGSRSEANIA